MLFLLLLCWGWVVGILVAVGVPVLVSLTELFKLDNKITQKYLVPLYIMDAYM